METGETTLFIFYATTRVTTGQDFGASVTSMFLGEKKPQSFHQFKGFGQMKIDFIVILGCMCKFRQFEFIINKFY